MCESARVDPFVCACMRAWVRACSGGMSNKKGVVCKYSIQKKTLLSQPNTDRFHAGCSGTYIMTQV